ncbi:hypothetical protein [Streptomyces glaucescens]|uniref:Uncharacterized protein n=1 Tax=Streptomyces glaucescens TaxID=1907 RepID=A0A089Z1H6_STRGA|nr:hypothetical protein [Streptomyces glaucescens]AIR99695.1 hypothetical protein SGLAU_18675 [Streptomyces glaucescens]
MGCFRALKQTARSGLAAEREPLEPLLAPRGAAGLAGRAAMPLQARLPDRDAPPVPPAARRADALREATAHGARAVRERRDPRWETVQAALTDPA